MASICIETAIDAPAAQAWAALRDWGALHEKLAAGFAVDTRVDGDDRLVTFFTGTTLRERIIGIEDEQRRLAWSIVDGPYTHHHGAAQVVERDGSTVFVWWADLLPHAAAERPRELMERG